MMRDESGRPKSMFKNLRKLHGQGLESQGLNNLSDAFQTFVTRARFFSIGHLRRTWSHSAVEFMKYRRRLPALMSGGDGGGESDSSSDGEGTSSVIVRSAAADEAQSDDEGPSAFSRFTSKSFREGSSAKDGNSTDSDRRRIYVSNVSYRATTSQLASFFSKFGKVATCSIPIDKMGTFPRHGGRPKSKGHAYVTFKADDGVLAARTARPDELKFYERVMVVSQPLPTPRKARQTSTDDVARDPAPLATIPAEDDSGGIVSASDSESAPPSPAFVNMHINSLKDELMSLIIGQLDLRERVRVERVCKKWLECAYLSWTGERCLRLSEKRFGCTGSDGGRKPLQKATLLAILRRCGRSVTSLDMSGTPHFLDASALALVPSHCPNLTRINLTGLKLGWRELKLFAESAPGLKAITLRDAAGLGEKAFWYLFRNCKNLESVDLSGCRRLQGRCFRLLGIFLDEVRLNGCVGLEPEAVEEMSLKSPHLGTLSLDGAGGLSDQTIATLARSMNGLRRLSLAGPGLGGLTSSGLAQLGLMEGLEEVTLEHNAKVSDEVVESIAGGCVGLRRLSLAGAGEGECPGEVGLAALSACASLEELDVSFLPGLRDSVLVLALANLPKLRVLRLRGCRNLSDKGVIGLMRGANSLLELDLSGCLKVGKPGLESVVNRFPTPRAGSPGDDGTVSVVVGGSGCLGLSTKGSRVILDTSDYSTQLPSLPHGAGLRGGAEGDTDDEDMDDDEFESLTASRSFVMERLEEDDLVIDEGRLAEWEAQFRALNSSQPSTSSSSKP